MLKGRLLGSAVGISLEIALGAAVEKLVLGDSVGLEVEGKTLGSATLREDISHYKSKYSNSKYGKKCKSLAYLGYAHFSLVNDSSIYLGKILGAEDGSAVGCDVESVVGADEGKALGAVD